MELIILTRKNGTVIGAYTTQRRANGAEEESKRDTGGLVIQTKVKVNEAPQ